MKKLCFILCMCLLLTGCGSASSDYGYKDDLSDVIVKDHSVRDPTSFSDEAPDMEKDILVYYSTGEFKNYKEFGQDGHNRYYIALVIYNNRILDEDGNWDVYYDGDNSERSPELLEGALEDFEQYCKDQDIPYVIYEYKNQWAWLDLCISPEQFFAYDFLPQVSYDINFIIDETHESFDEFLGHVKKGERTAEPSLARQGYPDHQDLHKFVFLVEDFDKELNRTDLSIDEDEDDTELYKVYPQYKARSFDGEGKNVRGVFTNYEEYGVSADDHNQYFVSLQINNDWALDVDGNLSYVTEPDPEMLKNALEDFEQYCTDHDIPYVIYEYGTYSAWMYLCISPEQFFAYDFLPQVSYDIRFVRFQQRFDKFLRHIQKGEIRLYELESTNVLPPRFLHI